MTVIKKITQPKSSKKGEAVTFGMLGKEIKISPKSKVTINKPGFGIDFFVGAVDITIGIGKDHTAHLVMDEEAWKALKKGQTIDITTLKEFKEKFL